MMFPASLRMMAPLQAQNQQLQTQNQELQTRYDGLQSKCQELHRQVAALQPLAGRVRALEGVGTEEGGRRQRQRVGPAPHDAPPSDVAVAQLGVVDAVEAALDARESGTGGGEGLRADQIPDPGS